VRRFAWLLLGLVPAVFFAVPACSNQAEGERCETRSENGGNDDCQDGLICWKASDLGTNADLCCPPDRSRATVAACRLPSAPPGGDASIPVTPDASGDVVLPDVRIDGAGDTGTNDGASDAPSDAPGEGG
jgi:hypothetical protein